MVAGELGEPGGRWRARCSLASWVVAGELGGRGRAEWSLASWPLSFIQNAVYFCACPTAIYLRICQFYVAILIILPMLSNSPRPEISVPRSLSSIFTHI